MVTGGLFSGSVLNAVDAKGRVSLPSPMRAVIESRARLSALAGQPIDDKAVSLGRHEKYRCLQGFDGSHLQSLFAKLERKAAGADDEMAALDDLQMAAFSRLETVAFDAGGRMVLSQRTRAKAGIADLAWFLGAGETFQVWAPDRFLADCASMADACDELRDLLAERGITA